MKKFYITPDFDFVSYRLTDVLSASPTEETLPEVIGGDEDELVVGF